VLSKCDKILIEVLGQERRYDARKPLAEFPNKVGRWHQLVALSRLLI